MTSKGGEGHELLPKQLLLVVTLVVCLPVAATAQSWEQWDLHAVSGDPRAVMQSEKLRFVIRCDAGYYLVLLNRWGATESLRSGWVDFIWPNEKWVRYNFLRSLNLTATDNPKQPGYVRDLAELMADLRQHPWVRVGVMTSVGLVTDTVTLAGATRVLDALTCDGTGAR